MEETRPMPKRTRDDFVSIQKLCAMLDVLEAEATPWQVATQSASAMAEALHAHAVLIHQHDASRRELRSIGVHGPNAGDLLGTTTKVDDDYVVTAVLTNKKALTLRLDGSLPRFVPERHRVLGTTRSLSVYPVMRADGCVAVIEVVGLAEERQQSVKDACELVAQRLSVAFDSPPAPELIDSPTPSRRRAPVGSSRSEREGRALGATPVTFPKRAPTLLCRADHRAARAR